MQFEGEHLLIGQIGHFFVLLAFVASLLSTIGFFFASKNKIFVEKQQWLQFSRLLFYIQSFAVIIIFSIIFYICSHHFFEYMYAYKHASKELESKFLLACIWEGQEGSFLLWTLWHSVLGIFIINKCKDWEAPVMTVISFAQFFLGMMILGIYFFGIKIGNSPFTLTRNEIAGPIFSQANYLSFIKDGVGLNVLLRNYWMVIHPPILFLGFASTILPFAFAYAGLQTKRLGEWIAVALPYTLFSAAVLGVGIMMGGKWAYESLSFGGYWAWDPVENASLVPWLILIAGLHTMVIYKATGQSLKASYLFAILSFVFVLYSTFLTRTGILSDTSVHSFTLDKESVNITYVMLLLFLVFFAVPVLFLFFKNHKKILAVNSDDNTSAREFWMFIGSIVFFLSALFISAKTSTPVFNKIFGTNIAPPEDVEFSYNKVMVLVAFIVGLLTAVTQYLKYKSSSSNYLLKKITLPTLVSAIVTALLAVFYPLTYNKQGVGFLGAIYIALFAAIYAIVANAMYIWIGLNGKLKASGASITHFGFAVMLLGILISSANKKTITDNSVTGINLPFGKDSKENPSENLTMLRDVPTKMQDYTVTYFGDSAGNEKGRLYYKLNFTKKGLAEQFILTPDVYVGNNQLKSTNPSTKRYLTKDIYSYISSISTHDDKEDTTTFITKELSLGDTSFYSNGYFILNKVVKNPNNNKYKYQPTDVALMADITLISKDSMHYKAYPLIQIDSTGIINIDDTVYAQNMYLKFIGVTSNQKIKIGVRESKKAIDYVTLKAYLFPYINLVWLGLIIMTLGLLQSMIKRAKILPKYAAIILIFVSIAMLYMFFMAG